MVGNAAAVGPRADWPGHAALLVATPLDNGLLWIPGAGPASAGFKLRALRRVRAASLGTSDEHVSP